MMSSKHLQCNLRLFTYLGVPNLIQLTLSQTHLNYHYSPFELDTLINSTLIPLAPSVVRSQLQFCPQLCYGSGQ